MKLRPATSYSAIVGRVLVLARESAGIDQAGVAQAVGISQSTWSRIENGSSALTVEQLQLASVALNRSPGDILCDADRVAVALSKQGVKISNTRFTQVPVTGIALLSGVALGLLVAGLITSE